MSSQVTVFEADPAVSLSQLCFLCGFQFQLQRAIYAFHIIEANFLKFSSGFYSQSLSEVCCFFRLLGDALLPVHGIVFL